MGGQQGEIGGNYWSGSRGSKEKSGKEKKGNGERESREIKVSEAEETRG